MNLRHAAVETGDMVRKDNKGVVVTWRRRLNRISSFIALIATADALLDPAGCLYLFLIAAILFLIAHVVLPANVRFPQHRLGIGVAVFLCAPLAFAFTSYEADKIACPFPSITGPLFPSNLPAPPNACTATGPPKGPLIYFGGEAAMFSRREGHVALFRAVEENTSSYHDLMSLDFDAKGIPSLNAELYDENGLLLVRIEKNVPTAQGEGLCIVRPDLSTFVVQQRQLFRRPKELLFFRYLNPDGVIIRGLFAYRGHGTLKVTDKSVEEISGPLKGTKLVGTGGCLSYNEPTTTTQAGAIIGF